MKPLLMLTGVGEAATGLILILAPVPVGRWLLGAELTGAAVPVARVAGIALLALGAACWPGPALLGMLTYNVLATLYLGWLAVSGLWVGPLLWPAVAIHAILTVLLVRVWIVNQKVIKTAPDNKT